jgi:hypothetical protein
MGRRASRNHFAGTCLSERASLVLWEEGDWRCEFNPGLAGVGRLEVYQADQLILAEEALSGPSAAQRAEILRQRLLRGNLWPTKAPTCPKCGVECVSLVAVPRCCTFAATGAASSGHTIDRHRLVARVRRGNQHVKACMNGSGLVTAFNLLG